MQKIEDLMKIYNCLADDKSKRTFLAKYNYIMDHDEDALLEWMLKEETICCPELDAYEKNKSEVGYILFGSGKIGKRTKKILEKSGRNVVAWCDNNKQLWGNKIEEIQVVSPGELVTLYSKETVIITVPRENMLEVVQQIGMIGFPREKIVIPNSGFLIGCAGIQYFDMFSAEQKEIFVDAGCWNGETSVAFAKWCSDQYEKIYAFEPDEICWTLCEETFKKRNLCNIEFVKKGTWSKTDILHFSGIGRGSSKIDENARTVGTISVTSIDETVGEDMVTFIKLDVEGSELETLKGACRTIQRCKPKLAISVYHKPKDLWELANYVLQLNAEYKLYLRHYTTCEYETILYAV